MTTRELAQALNVSESTAYRLAKRGCVPARLPSGDYVTLKYFAFRRGLHIRSVLRWCKRGLMPGAYQVGREWRLPALTIPRPSFAPRGRTDTGQFA